MTSKIFNVGIIGYGLSAKIYQIPFIRAAKNLNLYAVVQRTPKPNDDAEKDWPGIKSFRSTELLIKDPAVDVVVVTTAPDSHLELAKLALNAGKHGMLRVPSTQPYMNTKLRSGSHQSLLKSRSPPHMKRPRNSWSLQRSRTACLRYIKVCLLPVVFNPALEP
jgi:hypothetical protein